MARIFFFLFLLFGVVTLSSDADATKYKSGEAYAEPNYRELVQTLIMMSDKVIKSPTVADEYAKLLYCDLYLEKYKNDFEWHNAREKIIDRVISKKEPYRILFEITSTIYLSRYSFDTQDFPFDPDSRIVNVSSMAFASGRMPNECLSHTGDVLFPSSFSLLLSQPLTLDRFKVPANEAEKLLAKIEKGDGERRKIYARFRIRVQSIVEDDAKMSIKKRKKIKKSSVAFDSNGAFRGELTGIDLFLDRELTKHIANIPID